MRRIVLTGGPHDGIEMAVPAETDYIGRYIKADGRLELHGYRRTNREADGIILFEHVGIDLEPWDRVKLGETGNWTVDLPDEPTH